jgi:hypothetical protein
MAHLRSIGEQSWQEKFGMPTHEIGVAGPQGSVGMSYMMASAPAGGQTYTAQNLGIK